MCLGILTVSYVNASHAEISATDILNMLVDEGILSEEKVKQLVDKARTKNESSEQESNSSKNPSHTSTVRVPYIPNYIKDDISSSVKEEVLDDIKPEIIEHVRATGWGIKEAPEWVYRTSISGDVRVRYSGEFYPNDNPTDPIFDIDETNDAGGVANGSRDIILNLTDDRQRLRGRARLMFTSRPSENLEVGIRLTSGNSGNPVSANQTLGKYGKKWESSFDLAYFNYTSDAKTFGFEAGRFKNPWLHSDLIWDSDMTFEGINTTYAPMRSKSTTRMFDPYIQIGAFPLQEIHQAILPGDSVDPPNDDKWLYAGQLGTNINFSENSVISFAVSYFYFKNVVGVDNPINQDNQDLTASSYYQYGNTLQNIVANDPFNSTQRELYALASEFELLNLTLRYDYSGFDEHHLWFMADKVENKAFDSQEVSKRIGVGFIVPDRSSGYELGLGFGSKKTNGWGDWQLGFNYRYLEGDAVIDAFADSDFLLGGTNAKGYILKGDLWLADNLSVSFRWLSAEEIDAADVPDPLNPGQFIVSDIEVDTFFLDLNAKF